jgi:hypothetical protein
MKSSILDCNIQKLHQNLVLTSLPDTYINPLYLNVYLACGILKKYNIMEYMLIIQVKYTTRTVTGIKAMLGSGSMRGPAHNAYAHFIVVIQRYAGHTKNLYNYTSRN